MLTKLRFLLAMSMFTHISVGYHPGCLSSANLEEVVGRAGDVYPGGEEIEEGVADPDEEEVDIHRKDDDPVEESNYRGRQFHLNEGDQGRRKRKRRGEENQEIPARAD